MNLYISITTLLILIILVVREVRIWKMRSLLSPGLYFGLIWGLGCLGLSILSPVGLVFERNPQYIDELNILVSFTAICFIIWTKKGRNEVIEEPITLNISDYRTYKILSFVFFVGALYDFISLGSNFNMGEARANLHDILGARSVIIGYIQTLSIPLSVYAGYSMVNKIQKVGSTEKSWSWLFLPLVANLIFSVSIGGRVNVVFCFSEYLLGFSFALPLNQSLKNVRKTIVLIAFFALFVMYFITAVSNQRNTYSSGQRSEVEVYLSNRSPVLGAIYGPISYIISSYNGYQLRRVDAVDLEHLGYGQYTFNGFINWTLPFSSQLGFKDFSIAKIFDIYYNNQETYDFERELYYTTHSCYIPIIKDYGFFGAFICIFFLTFIAHNLFVKVQKKDSITYVSSIFLFYLFWHYWNHSNFYGSLSSSILVPFYGFLFVDIIKYLKK